MNVYRPTGYQSLDSYIQQQPEQNAQVAAEVRKSALSLVDNIQDGLAHGDDRGTMALMGELQTSLRQLATSRQAHNAANDSNGRALLQTLKGKGELPLDGQTIRMQPEQQETSTTGLVQPHGPVDMGAWEYPVDVRAVNPPDVASGKYRVVSSTLQYGAQTPYISDSDEYCADHGVGDGLARLSSFAANVSHEVGALLAEPGLRNSMELSVDQSSRTVSASDVHIKKELLGRANISASSQTVTTESLHAESKPTMEVALGDLDTLRDGLSTLQGNPSWTVPIRADRSVSETAVIERTGLLGKVAAGRKTVEVPLEGYNSGGWTAPFTHEARAVMNLPYIPAYIDASFG